MWESQIFLWWGIQSTLSLHSPWGSSSHVFCSAVLCLFSVSSPISKKRKKSTYSSLKNISTYGSGGPDLAAPKPGWFPCVISHAEWGLNTTAHSRAGLGRKMQAASLNTASSQAGLCLTDSPHGLLAVSGYFCRQDWTLKSQSCKLVHMLTSTLHRANSSYR